MHPDALCPDVLHWALSLRYWEEKPENLPVHHREVTAMQLRSVPCFAVSVTLYGCVICAIGPGKKPPCKDPVRITLCPGKHTAWLWRNSGPASSGWGQGTGESPLGTPELAGALPVFCANQCTPL